MRITFLTITAISQIYHLQHFAFFVIIPSFFIFERQTGPIAQNSTGAFGDPFGNPFA